jgi:hypothetical protein
MGLRFLGLGNWLATGWLLLHYYRVLGVKVFQFFSPSLIIHQPPSPFIPIPPLLLTFYE